MVCRVGANLNTAGGGFPEFVGGHQAATFWLLLTGQGAAKVAGHHEDRGRKLVLRKDRYRVLQVVGVTVIKGDGHTGLPLCCGIQRDDRVGRGREPGHLLRKVLGGHVHFIAAVTNAVVGEDTRGGLACAF